MSGNDRLVEAAESIAESFGTGLGAILSIDPLTEDFNQADPGNYVLGKMYSRGQRTYVFCKEVANAVPGVAGDVAFHDDSGVRGEVTTDYSENLADLLRPVGVYPNSPDDGNYFFLLVLGPYATVNNNGDDDITAGLDIIATAADHGVVNAGARTLATGVGIAYEADVDGANTVGVNVNCLANW